MGFLSVTCAGYASRASPPPFSKDSVFRTMLSSCMVAPWEANIFVSFSFSSRRMGGMGAGSRADPPPRMQKRGQGHQDSSKRRTGGKQGCSTLEPFVFPHQCMEARQRWSGNYANISGELNLLHQWVLITNAPHCLQSATLHPGSANLTEAGYHMPAVLQE